MLFLFSVATQSFFLGLQRSYAKSFQHTVNLYSFWYLPLGRDLSGIMIAIRMKLLNTAGKQITTLTGIRRKLLIGKAG